MTGDLEFSKSVQYQVNMRKSYNELIKRQSGKTKSNGNIVRRANVHGIKSPKTLLTLQLRDNVTFCKDRVKLLKNSHSKGLHRVHLWNYLIRVEDLNGRNKVKHIKQVINHEQKGKMWYWINHMTDDHKTRDITNANRMVERKTASYTDQESMVNYIQEEI